MIPLGSLALFMAATLTLNVTPGPDMLYVMGRSLTQGRRAGVLSALGIGTGTLFHVSAAALGLSTLFMTSAVLFQAVKYLGGGYLVYLGIRTLLDREPLEARTLPKLSRGRMFGQAVVTNVLNPKVALFFLAFLPQFVERSRGNIILQIVMLGCLFNVSGTLVNISVAWLSGSLRQQLQTSPRLLRIQRLACGTLFVGLGVKLALARRG